MARSTSFLATEIRAVVHTRWRDSQPGDLSCQPGDLSCQPGDLSCQPGDLSCQPGDLSCQPGDLSCEHKRPNRTTKQYGRSSHPANAACIRRQHRSPKKLNGRPILNFLPVHISEFLIFLREAQPVCHFLWSPSFQHSGGGCPRPGTIAPLLIDAFCCRHHVSCSVLVLHIKPVFLLVDIQHTQCPR